jgi:hypothetical protein
MAVLTGVLKADFSEFKSAADEAVGKLRTMEGAAGTTTSAFKSAETATGQWGSALVGLAGAFGIAFSVNSIKNFAIGVIETGAAVGDMAQKLGISAEAVQRFGYAADQSGASIQTVDRAIKAMNENLAQGSTSTIAALTAAGLEFDNIRRMAPEDAFVAIGDAVAGIEDPMTRAQVATELFGKAGQELIPTFLAGIEQVGAATKVMSDDTVERLKAAQDAWSRFGNSVTVYSGEAIGGMSRFFGAWQKASELLAEAANPFVAIPKALQDFSLTADAATQAGSDLGAMVATITPPVNTFATTALKPVALNAAQAEAEIAYMNATLVKAPAAIALTEPRLGSLTAFIREAQKETEVWNSGLVFTSEVIGELPPKLEAAASAVQQLGAAQAAATPPGMTQMSPGASIPINTGPITYGTLGSFEATFAEYAKRHPSGGALGGAIGGGPPADFLTWALSMGLAQRGPTVTNTFNIVDTESGIARRVGDTITGQIQQGSMLN